MREIKFRSWDEPFKLFIYWDNSGNYDDDMFWGVVHGLPLMQWTGLKDKNGKEIYEGDITHRGVIEFYEGKFQGVYIDGNGGLAECWEDDLHREDNLEVIGNIYENPELLKD